MKKKIAVLFILLVTCSPLALLFSQIHCLGYSIFRRVYNIVDDDPAPREEVFEYARNLIDKKWPGQIKWHTDKEDSIVTVKKEGSSSEKRVSNARMKKELGVTLLHPSYRTGLESIIDQMEKNPFQHSLFDS